VMAEGVNTHDRIRWRKKKPRLEYFEEKNHRSPVTSHGPKRASTPKAQVRPHHTRKMTSDQRCRECLYTTVREAIMTAKKSNQNDQRRLKTVNWGRHLCGRTNGREVQKKKNAAWGGKKRGGPS